MNRAPANSTLRAKAAGAPSRVGDQAMIPAGFNGSARTLQAPGLPPQASPLR